MRYQGFIGPSNPTQSAIADAERTINWYVEQVQSRNAPTDATFYPVPGQRTLFTVPQVGARALFSMNDRHFGVYGSKFYELYPLTQTYIERGTVAQDNNPATICGNGPVGNQLGITSGGNWYNYDLGTNTLTQVSALTGKATQGGMKDTFFLCFNVNTGTVYVSAANDGTTWNTVTGYFQRTIAPDPWKAMVVGNPQIYMLGEQTSEAWYDAGNPVQPFAPILSSFMQHGTPASFASQMAEDALVFLSEDKSGQGIVMAARGYSPTPISNYSVESAIQGYARTSTIADAEILVYQDQGHLFANLGFVRGNATWTVDVKTGLWHERDTRTPQNQYNLWSPRVHCYANGLHLVGDRSTGNINVLDATVATEADGSVIRRLRVGPPIWAAPRQRVKVDRFTVYAEPGLGTTSGQGVNPLMMLRSSQDGKTWGNERQASAGALGQYRKRIFWTRCGASQNLWMPEVTCTDPIPWRLSGADLEGSGFEASTRAA